MKVVTNACYGGFELSAFAVLKLIEKSGKELYVYSDCVNNNTYLKMTLDGIHDGSHFVCSTIDFGNVVSADKLNAADCLDYFYVSDVADKFRFDEDLISLIEEFGSEKISGFYANLTVQDIASGNYFRIADYDGLEIVEIFDRANFPYYAE